MSSQMCFFCRLWATHRFNRSLIEVFLPFVQIDSRNLKIEIMILTLFVSLLTDCEFEQEVKADGSVFVPAGSGPCLKCRCKVSVWGIACRKCWILEGTEKSQQQQEWPIFKNWKYISHMHWWLFIFMETCLTVMASMSDFSHWSCWLVLWQIYTDSWESISNTPTHHVSLAC